MMSNDRAVCVTVDSTRRLVNGLDWKTTAHDVIQRLKPGPRPQILVESWRGCVRRIEKDEYICQLLEEWGDEAKHVQLVLMSSHSLPGYRLAKRGLNKAQIYKAQRHGKVACNKRRCLSRISTPKKNITEEIVRLIARVKAAREGLAAVQELDTQPDILPESPQFELCPLEEEEWVALQEQLAEEEQEARELEERGMEIRQKIYSQSDEITKLKSRNLELQRKLFLEQEKQRRLSGENNRELEKAQEQVERLQSELKVRMKLNQLQATKMREVSSLVAAMDQESQETV